MHIAAQEGARLHLPSSHIHSRLRSGNVHHAMRLFKYIWGELYNGKLALRYKHALTDACPLCGHPDSCTHMGSGCPTLSGHYINRHNAAVRLIADFLTHGPKGASAIHESLRLLYMDAGRHERPMDEDFEDLAAGSEAL